jgi:hypothetical protein
MISCAHSGIFSKEPEKDRAFFRDLLKLTHVDVGDCHPFVHILLSADYLVLFPYEQ